MLGAPCSPCCGRFQCPDSIVVQIAPSVTSSKWLADHSGCFILVNKVGSFENNLACLMIGQVSAHTSRIGGDAQFFPYCGGIPTQIIDIFGALISDQASGTANPYLQLRALHDQCTAPGQGIEFFGGAEMQRFPNGTESASVPGQFKWWTLSAWNAAKADPNNNDVPSDARLLTADSILNPWDFSRSDVPIKYQMTISDLPSGSGQFSKFAGVYDITGSLASFSPFLFNDWPLVDYETGLSPPPLRYRIRGYAGLTWLYRENGQYPLHLEVVLLLEEFSDEVTMVRATQLTTHSPPSHLFPLVMQSATSVSLAPHRPAPDGLTANDEFTANIHILQGQWFGGGSSDPRTYGPSVGTCRITLSSVMP